MELSSEDELRLNVLAASASAIRIDENRLIAYGWTPDRELQVQLHPVGNVDNYLQRARAVLSTAVLGAPNRYPMHLRRWADMGQINNSPLEKLLLLGEPEAVFGVASSQRLTNELARLVWWAEPTPQLARKMLGNESVVAGDVGRTLAAFLVEHLPFESDPAEMLETATLVLQPGLIDDTTRRKLWDLGRRRRTYRIGFLIQCPWDLPVTESARVSSREYTEVCEHLARSRPELGRWLQEILLPPARVFLSTCKDTLLHANAQEEVSAILNAIGDFFKPKGAFEFDTREPQWAPVRREIESLQFLSAMNDELTTPVFARSDAVGSVMRQQTAHLIAPLLQQIDLITSG